MTYSEKLLDPRWQKCRLKVMERDNFMCKDCFATKITLNVHHLRYHNDPWDSPPEELVTLCKNCHQSREDEIKNILEIVKYQAKLRLGDSFITSCVGRVFEKWEKLDDLFFMLFEALDYQDEVNNFLEELFQKHHPYLNNTLECQESEV